MVLVYPLAPLGRKDVLIWKPVGTAWPTTIFPDDLPEGDTVLVYPAAPGVSSEVESWYSVGTSCPTTIV